MPDIQQCEYCGRNGIDKTMIVVEETDSEDERLWFCDWTHVYFYALAKVDI
jgi:hypothetical protein